MEENKQITQIDFVKIYNALKARKKLFYYSLPIAFVLASLIILSVPRYYTCSVKLVPEISSMSSNSLSSLASSFGFDLDAGSGGTDAIVPELYPDLMESVEFKTSMFPVKVVSQDGEINTTYYNYLLLHQKAPWWMVGYAKFLQLFKKKETEGLGGEDINPFNLSVTQTDIASAVGGNIKCKIDKKTYVLTITTTAQDPLICATLADSAKSRLQSFITEYRTHKAQIDLAYNKQLFDEAREQYEEARKEYSRFADANQDVILQRYRSKVEDLENVMQLRFNIYSQASAQLQNAQARLQEKTPAFSTLQSATVPVKPAGPKRVIFVLIVVLLTFVGTGICAYYKYSQEEPQVQYED